MQVFKTYFKIIKRNIVMIFIYIGVFLALAIAFSLSSSTNSVDNFTQSKTQVAFINEDENSVLIEGFKEYLAKYSEYVAIEDNTEKLQDALFFREVDYIAKIPKGFTKAIMEGKESKIRKTVVAGSTKSIYTDRLVNNYFNTAKLYLNNYKDITQAELVKQVAKDLKINTNVKLMTGEGQSADNWKFRYFFNFLSYALISAILLGVTSIMMVFNNKNLRRRNLCSPIRNSSINSQILLGNVVFGIVCWGLMLLCGVILHRDQMFTTTALYYCINSFVFTITTLCMAFLAGIFVKTSNAQSGITNVLGLGLSFIGGVFVSQELLSKSVLAIAKFTPTYWFVKANTAISNLSNFSMENLTPIFQDMIIQLGFAVAILSVGLVLSKRKQMSGN